MTYHSKIIEVKDRVNIADIVRRYGVYLSRNNKARCPFHSEKTASFSVHEGKQIYKCFGCGKGGDSIAFVSILFKVNAYEAAKIINRDFGCGVDFDRPVQASLINTYKSKQDTVKQFEQWIEDTYITLTDYYKLLKACLKFKDPDNELYIEALKNINKIEYYIDFLIEAADNQKLEFWKYNRKVVKVVEDRGFCRRVS